MTYTYDFPMAGNTATMVLYRKKRSVWSLWLRTKVEVLLGLRSEDSDAYPEAWSLPGGYLNAGTERLVNVARRETLEETGLDIDERRWVFFYNDDVPGTDPRYVQVINLCYTADVTKEEYNAVKAADDLADVKWVNIEKARGYDLAFAHNTVLEEFYKFNT